MADVKFEQRLDDHIKHCDMRFKEHDERYDRLLDSQERCNDAITNLANKTQGVVELYTNARGVMSLAQAAQKLGLWIAKWSVVAVGITALYSHFN